MKHWITPDGSYYFGEHVAEGSIEIDGKPLDMIKAERIEALQIVYDADRKRLNDAWLSAMITGGADEAPRKAAIQQQMDALDAQFETDVLTIMMEE